MDFAVLGPLEVAHRGESISIRRGLPRGLMIYLLLHRRVPVSTEVLADRLWPAEVPADAANAVQRVVSYLRRTLGDSGHELLATRPAGYALHVDDEALDACHFEHLVHVAVESVAEDTAAGAHRALAEVTTALTLWRGAPLSDVDQHEWAIAEAARLAELKAHAHSLGLSALLTLNRTDEAVAQARALVTEYPLQERFHGQLVLSLYRGGRQGEALAAYAAARRMLGDELGLDPSPQLQTLERQVLEQSPAIDWVPPADWSTATAASVGGGRDRSAVSSTAPPAALTSLVGRDTALLQLSRALAETRVLTLTGTGGVGKSRLALELARQETTRRVCWVQLEVVTEPGLVTSTLAQALGVTTPADGSPLPAVARTIGGEQVLLVLDGCEHVATATAELVDHLQRSCPSLVQLVTSRRPLRVAGEVTWPVLPLDLPTEGGADPSAPVAAAAVVLFQQRAQAARPSFVVDDSNAADVAAIVVALDGLPLAIELAAAHIDVLPPASIRQRLADRFELLRSDQWDASVRQRTLRAVIDSSVALLTVEERDHLRQLAVFAGSFDLEGVEAVTDAAPAAAYRLTASLVRQSLVAPVDAGRFRLLESVRAYAVDDLRRSPHLAGVHDRHAEYVLRFMTAADAGLHGPRDHDWMSRIRETVPDLRSALSWLLDGADPTRGALLAATSSWFWTREGMLDEAARWMRRALAVEVQDASVRAAVLHGSGRIAAPQGELIVARDACLASSELSRDLHDDAALGRSLVTLGLCQWALGDLSAAAATHDEAAARAEAASDRWHRDVALVLRLRTAIDAGEPDLEQRLDRVLCTVRSSGDPHVSGLALGQRARLGLISGDPARAYATAEASLNHWRSVGYREGELQALNLLARASILAGLLDEAARTARTAVLMADSIGHRGGLLEGLETLAAVQHAAGRDDLARELLTVADQERTLAAIPIPAGDRALIDQLRRTVSDPGPGASLPPTRARDLPRIIADLRDDTDSLATSHP